MEHNVEDNVSEPTGQDGLDKSTLGRLKSPCNKVVKVFPLLSNRQKNPTIIREYGFEIIISHHIISQSFKLRS